MKENLSKLCNLLGKILKVDPKKINEKTSPENTESWDSFNGLMVVAETEKQFGLSLSIDEVVNIKSVGDLVGSLRKHGINI